jgi:tripartite ATP-independent transporter DctP family solute receptor
MKPSSIVTYASAALVALIAMAGASNTSLAQEFSMRAATIGAPGGIQDVGLQKLKEVAEARSDGRISITIHTGGALGDQISNIEALQTSTLDIATIETPITQIDPLMGVFGLPYIFRSREHVDAVLNGPIGEEISERLAQHDVRAIGYYEGGFRQITNNVRPIYTPEDLQGITMRTPESRLRIKIFNHYGANASPLPYPELYTALQTGVFDGQENPAVEVAASRFYEVQKYLSFTNHVYTVGFLLMGEQLYQQLPDDLRQVMDEAARAASAATVEFGRQADAEIADLAQSRGMEVNEADIDSFVEASEPIWAEEAEDLGPEAADLIDRIVETEG